MTGRAFRSVHFVPAHQTDWLKPALAERPDVIVLDLEDSVPTALKATASENALAALRGWPMDAHSRPFLRLDVPLSDGRIELLRSLDGLATNVGFVLPKFDGTLDAALGAWMRGHDSEAIALIESWSAMRTFMEHRPPPFVKAVAVGTEDLVADPATPPHSCSRLLEHVKTSLATAALAYGVRPLEGVHTNVGDVDAFESRIRSARERGCFGGMSIHPRQIAPLNRTFTVDSAAVEKAEQVVETATESAYDGGYVKVGSLVLSPPKVARARHVLAHAKEGPRS